MNNVFEKFSKLILGVVLAAIVVSCNNNKDKPAAKTTTVSDDKKELIVYVNSDSLSKNYEYFKDMRVKFQDKSKKAQVDLNSKGTAFQREVAEYQKSAATMSADQRASTEERLARKQQELQAYNQNAGSALANEEAVETGKLYDKLSQFLKSYSKKKGYKLVLTYSKANPTVLFADESLDITSEVVKGLNEEYKNEKK